VPLAKAHATPAAVEEGILPGGGVALLRARSALGKLKGDNVDQNAGIRIVLRALEQPLPEIEQHEPKVPSSSRTSAGSRHRRWRSSVSLKAFAIACCCSASERNRQLAQPLLDQTSKFLDLDIHGFGTFAAIRKIVSPHASSAA
jgi:hypothetical protein